MSDSRSARLRLLVMASTYPRWSGDPEPGFVHELSRRLAADFDVVVLGPHAAGAQSSETMDGVRIVRYRYAPAALETLVNNGGIITNLRRSKWKWLLVPSFALMQAFAAWRLMRKQRPDVIHAHWMLPQGLVAAVATACLSGTPPFVVTSHGADMFALRSRVSRRIKRFVADRASAVTVVSEAMREVAVQAGVPPGKISVEPMGVDLHERFTPDPAVLRSTDEILFVGRLVEKKGVRHLIDALPLILERKSTAFLTIAGFGPQEHPLREQVARLGLKDKVAFLGAVDQESLPALYRRAAVFVAPFVEAASGDQEGLGLVVIEAAGCGCPCVVSRLLANADVIDESEGIMGLEPGNPAALAEAISELLVHGSPSRVRVSSRYDWTTRASAYARLLTAAIPQDRVRGQA